MMRWKPGARRTRTLVTLVLLLGTLGVPPAAGSGAATVSAAPAHVEGVLPSGASYVMDVPADWNRTVLLFSHGYTPQGAPNPARNAPGDAERAGLLARGYALIGSSYARTGWAFAEAVPDQLATLDAFTARFGRARRTVAWGVSYGGLVTTALAERHGHRFDGALALCGLEMGGVANWNSTLDAAFAVRTLLGPAGSVPLVRFPDQAAAVAAGGALIGAVQAAQATPAGRARTALAAALHNIPGWTDAAQPEPAPGDYEAQQRNQAQSLPLTLWAGTSWRQEAEARAGGNMAWNTGVDYARLLARSSMRAEVAALYARAGLSLAADLAVLAAAPRISADPVAVRYMIRNVAFTGRPGTPLLTVHTTGDGLVPVQAEQAYQRAVRAAGRTWLLRQAYVHRGGHCTFTPAETTAALLTLLRRVGTGRWSGTDPAALNRLAAALDPAAAPAYTAYRPAPYPRPFDLARSWRVR